MFLKLITLLFSFHFVFGYESNDPSTRPVQIELISPTLLQVNKHKEFLPQVKVRILRKKEGYRFIEAVLRGKKFSDFASIKARGECQSGEQIPVTSTEIPEVWILPDPICQNSQIKLCLAFSNGYEACGPFLEPRTLTTWESQSVKAIKTTVPDNEPLKIFISDGRSYLIPWNSKWNTPNFFADVESTLYLSLLIGGVFADEGLITLGGAQAVYWPPSSTESIDGFDPNLLGAQFRHTRSLGQEKITSGKNLNLSWSDFSLNYKSQPTGVFEGSSFYGVLIGSFYSAVGQSTDRLGGGIGFSFPYPANFLGINYPGHVYTYLELSVLPIDVNGDNFGIIVGAKANGIWLITKTLFFTGDLELRVVNYTFGSENSIFRPQVGFGLAF